ncbi:hypothetical protein AB1K70_08425 [Bremerella sp. JC770]|uniref:hypothetical protein n=1 Tax=Bremerella sp. JC770 TaxID=3232137 RepID=UPI0034588F72
MMRNLPFDVQIPRAKLEELSKSGPAVPTNSDQRRFVRFRQLKRAILKCEPTFPEVERSEQLSLGLITNISKDGIGLLYHMQLYPKERFVLRLENSGLMRFSVARCRKLGPKCYEIGATTATPIDIRPFISQ